MSPAAQILENSPDLTTLLERSVEQVSNVRFMPGVVKESLTTPDPPRKTLREHISDVDTIVDTIEGLEAEDLTEEARNELTAALLDAIAGTKHKIDNATRALATWEHLETAALAEVARLQLRAKRFAARRERLEGYLVATLETSGLKKIEGETSAIAIRLCPEKVVIDDEVALPAAYWREPPMPAPVPDKTAIKLAIAAGREVAGAHVERGRKLVRS